MAIIELSISLLPYFMYGCRTITVRRWQVVEMTLLDNQYIIVYSILLLIISCFTVAAIFY